MNDGYLRFQIVATNPDTSETTEAKFINIKEALTIYFMLYDLWGEKVKLYVVLGPYKFSYIFSKERWDSDNRKFEIVFKDCDKPIKFDDLNKVLIASEKLANAGAEELQIVVKATVKPFKRLVSNLEEKKLDLTTPPKFTTKNIQKQIVDKSGPEDEGKPNRETIISKDEIVNLRILLNSEISYEDFLAKI